MFVKNQNRAAVSSLLGLRKGSELKGFVFLGVDLYYHLTIRREEVRAFSDRMHRFDPHTFVLRRRNVNQIKTFGAVTQVDKCICMTHLGAVGELCYSQILFDDADRLRMCVEKDAVLSTLA